MCLGLQLSFDYKKELVAFFSDASTGNQFPAISNKSRAMRRIVHDYRSGLAFTMPIDMSSVSKKTCNISSIDGGFVDSQVGGYFWVDIVLIIFKKLYFSHFKSILIYNWYLLFRHYFDESARSQKYWTEIALWIDGSAWFGTLQDENSSVIHIRHAGELFGLGTNNWIYIGQRDFNNALSDVWACQHNTTDKTVLVEAYWLPVSRDFSLFPRYLIDRSIDSLMHSSIDCSIDVD